MQCASSCSCGTHKPALIGEVPCSHSQPTVRHGGLVRRELTAVANLLAQIIYNKSADGVVLLCPGQAVIETAMRRQDDVDSNLLPTLTVLDSRSRRACTNAGHQSGAGACTECRRAPAGCHWPAACLPAEVLSLIRLAQMYSMHSSDHSPLATAMSRSAGAKQLPAIGRCRSSALDFERPWTGQSFAPEGHEV